MNMHVPVATVLQFSIFSYNHIKETFLLFSFEGITPKRLLILKARKCVKNTSYLDLQIKVTVR